MSIILFSGRKSTELDCHIREKQFTSQEDKIRYILALNAWRSRWKKKITVIEPQTYLLPMWTDLYPKVELIIKEMCTAPRNPNKYYSKINYTHWFGFSNEIKLVTGASKKYAREQKYIIPELYIFLLFTKC